MIFEVPLIALYVPNELETLAGRIRFGLQSIRLVLLLSLAISTPIHAFRISQDHSEEAKPLLPGETHSPTTSLYGTEPFGDVEADDDDDDDDEAQDMYIKERQRQRLKQSGNWWTYLKGFSILLPYLLPKKDTKVQLCMVINVLCLLGDRVLNVLVPRQLGIVIDRLVSGGLPIKELGVWLVLELSNSDTGLGLIRGLVKIPIEQFSYRQITNAAFEHIMNLSIDFHNDRDSAEVMTAIEQGKSLNNLLEAFMADVAPAFVDVIIGSIYIYKTFNAHMSFIILVASAVYVYLEVVFASWNQENRRLRAKTKREEAKVMHQAVQGWQTVSYFGKFHHEKSRFAEAVRVQLAASRDYDKRALYTSALDFIVIPLAFFAMSCLALFEISRGEATPGDFMFLVQYWDRLIYPVEYIASHYRWLMGDLIDAERLLVLFQTKPSITDKEGATPLKLTNGKVEFKGVYFAYDPRKPTLEDVNIDASAGQTIALVGETGAGKSSILKLIFRFYDISVGRIEIDGQDIRDVTLSSLRDVLGIVPQDPVLFNATVIENLRYARSDATNEDVYNACKAAAVHEKIMSFPDQYRSKVGEKGVKLSGGELQRIAIARVLLKNPPIVLFDEATSAVDTGTEASIQESLTRLSTSRTTFVIAHRLSTVVAADKILVLHEGRILEQGTHQELLRLNGRYHALWSKQIGNGMELI